MGELSERMASELGAVRQHGMALLPPEKLEAAFDWALSHDTEVAWIEAIMISERGTEPSMEYSRDTKNFSSYDEFRNSCLAVASAWNEVATGGCSTAYFEVGLSES